MKCTYPDCNCPFDMGADEKCLIGYEASGMSEFTELLEEIGVSFTVSADQSIIVYGYLDLKGTQITELPDNLSVGGSLYLEGTQITNVANKAGCGEFNRTIFAAWINREIQIGAGCFLGSLDMFFSAVDRKYSGPAAEQYKADAQDCVDRLTEILAMRQAG